MLCDVPVETQIQHKFGNLLAKAFGRSQNIRREVKKPEILEDK